MSCNKKEFDAAESGFRKLCGLTRQMKKATVKSCSLTMKDPSSLHSSRFFLKLSVTNTSLRRCTTVVQILNHDVKAEIQRGSLTKDEELQQHRRKKNTTRLRILRGLQFSTLAYDSRFRHIDLSTFSRFKYNKMWKPSRGTVLR